MIKKVEVYIEKQDSIKKTLLKRSRELILNTIPNCKEEFRWGVPVYDGGKFYIAAMKERIHIGFAITGLSEEEIRNFEGSGKTMRHIKVRSVEEFDMELLKRLVKLVHKKTSCPPDYK
ncbi:DUF1801 domain-containing protein [Candidatus Woesebacteria bacterium]|nr:DUF1801 domain-containing protein [Candidatus Woesebacteria bacterium]